MHKGPWHCRRRLTSRWKPGRITYTISERYKAGASCGMAACRGTAITTAEAYHQNPPASGAITTCGDLASQGFPLTRPMMWLVSPMMTTRTTGGHSNGNINSIGSSDTPAVLSSEAGAVVPGRGWWAEDQASIRDP